MTITATQKEKWKLILITALFAFIFINVFEPFDTYGRHSGQVFLIFIEICIAIIGVILSMILTQFFIRPILKIKTFNYFTITLWFLFECLMISIIWTFMILVIEDSELTIIELVVEHLIECIFLISLPFFGTVFYLNTLQKKQTIKELEKIVAEDKIDGNTIISIKDKLGKEKLSLRLKDILYLESADNYVTIHYLSLDKVEKQFIRNTIKNLEEELIPFNIVRCHRSYLVNILNVQRKEKLAKGNHFVVKHIDLKPIPISKSYTSEMDKILK